MRNTAYLLVVVVLLCAVPALAQGPFNDVPTDHWAYDAVNTLQRDGIVIGYPDGTFGGKRAMSRYEFAVAIARLVPMISPGSPAAGVTNAELQNILKDYAKKSDIPDISKLATKADVDALRKLVDEFQNELAALGVDVDALKRDVCALTARVDALEAEMRRVRFSGDVNVFGIASDHRSGLADAQDLDQRTINDFDTLGRSISVVKDFDLNIVGRISDTTNANATINYGNYLNYLAFVDDYVNTDRPTSKGPGTLPRSGSIDADTLSDNFFPYYLYINSALGKGQLNLGRFPIQFTPYTLKKIDVDSYTSILKTDSGNYPMDGAMLSNKFGGVDVTLFAAKNNTNDYLVNGLTGQPNIGLFGDTKTDGFDFFDGVAVGHAVGGLDGQVAQTAGGRIMFGTPWNGNIGATFYQAWSEDAGGFGPDPITDSRLYDQARVFGGDITIPFGNLGIAGSWTRSDLLARDNAGVANVNDDNTAWDAALSFGLGKLDIDAGYKNIERQFAAAGFWDKIGRWTNPTNVKGPYAELTYPISSKVQFVANGEFLKMIDDVRDGSVWGDEDDEILAAEGGIKWGLSKANSLDLGYQWVKFQSDNTGVDDAFETYLTIGWAHQLSTGMGFKIGYQFIGYDDGAGGVGPYTGDYRAGQGVVQFGVSF